MKPKGCRACDKAKEAHIRRRGRAFSFWVMCNKHADAFAGGLGAMAAKKGYSTR